MKRGKFITLEGIDGAGKSSHIDFLASRIRALGADVVVTREPGGTPLGAQLRDLALRVAMDAKTEAIVMFAARSELIARVIEPALLEGRWVLCDRFSDATFAYQCGGRGLDRGIEAALEGIVHPALQPDATFLFDVDPAIAYERQRAQSRTPDKFERETADFFGRVRQAYLERAHAQPKRIHVIDATGAIDAVRASLGEAFDRAVQ